MDAERPTRATFKPPPGSLVGQKVKIDSLTAGARALEREELLYPVLGDDVADAPPQEQGQRVCLVEAERRLEELAQPLAQPQNDAPQATHQPRPEATTRSIRVSVRHLRAQPAPEGTGTGAIPGRGRAPSLPG